MNRFKLDRQASTLILNRRFHRGQTTDTRSMNQVPDTENHSDSNYSIRDNIKSSIKDSSENVKSSYQSMKNDTEDAFHKSAKKMLNKT